MYYPAWLIDCDMRAKVRITGHDDQASTQLVSRFSFADTFMPGFNLDPLSRISFKDDYLRFCQSIPFSAELMHQQGMDVICPPFTHTPFSLGSMARSLSLQQARITEHLRFDPTTVTTKFMAAFPLLIPVYLLQYEAGWPERGKTYQFYAFADAHTSIPRFIVQNITDVLLSFRGWSPRPGLNKFVENMPAFDSLGRDSDQIYFSHCSGLSHGVDTQFTSKINQWIDLAASQKGSMEKYEKLWREENTTIDGGRPAVNFDDLRVRVYNEEERLSIRNYSQLCSLEERTAIEIERLKSILGEELESALEGLSVVRVNTHDYSDDSEAARSERFVTEVLEKVEASRTPLETVQELRRQHKPTWLKEWDEQNKVIDGSASAHADTTSREKSS